jgi:hypothetical protein
MINKDCTNERYVKDALKEFEMTIGETKNLCESVTSLFETYGVDKDDHHSIPDSLWEIYLLLEDFIRFMDSWEKWR